MRLSTILLFLVFMCIENAFGQQDSKESYRKFKNRSSSQRSAATLLEEADDLKADEPGEALDKVEEALGVSIAQGDQYSEGRGYMLLGEINESIQEWNLAFENYLKADEKLRAEYSKPKKIGSPSEVYVRTLRGLGNSCLKLGRYEDALRYYQEAIALHLPQSDENEVLLNISEVYYQMGNYDEALKAASSVSTQGRAKSGSSQNNRLENQKAKIYAHQDDGVEKSKDILENSINAARENKNVAKEEEQSLIETKDEVAGVLRGQKKYDEEIDLRKQSIEYNLEANNLSEVTRDKVEIGKTLVAKGENTAGLKQMEEAARMAESLEDPKEQANAFLSLAELCEKNGKTLQALAAYKKYSEAVAKMETQTAQQLSLKTTLVNKQKDIQDLSMSVSLGRGEVSVEQSTMLRQKLIIYGLLLIIGIIGVTSYFIYKSAQTSKLANQMLALKSLRSQMNPHFIFNALNSVNHFIAQQDERTANKFLSEFSQLMRLVLENSQQDFIPLEREKEILALYLKLEHYRFRDKFDYQIDIADDVHAENVEVPPMLIQPYIENAVWHGLRYKDAKGMLKLRIRKEPKDLVVEITDDGIGRAKSTELKTLNQKKHNSTGLKNIQERLSILNKVYRSNYRVTIEDLVNPSGTRVLIYLPYHTSTNGL